MGGTFFCIMTLIYMLFGVLFYELRAVTYIDEAFSIAIALYACLAILMRKIPLNKPLIVWFAISFFYLIYSFVIESNVPQAIVSDFIMQSKPYLVFFGLMCIKPRLSPHHYTILQGICWLSLFMIVAIYVYHPDDRIVATSGVMLTGEALSAVAILIGALFYLCSDYDRAGTRVTTLLIMCAGILSPTSKFWAILVCVFVILFFVNRPLKVNLKYLLLGLLAVGAIIWFVKDEFIFYFVEDFEYNTRPMLYITMWDVLADYIPFGSGFGTYANPASMTWYSPIYEKYNLDVIWGLDEGNTEHFAADAYYPIFAQFGYVGIALFVIFFIYLFKQINSFYNATHDIKRYKTSLIIVAYILIQATSNSLANERIVLAMTILVLSLYRYSPAPILRVVHRFTPPIIKSDESTANQ